VEGEEDRLTWNSSGALVTAGAEDGGVFRAWRNMQELCSTKLNPHFYNDSVPRFGGLVERHTVFKKYRRTFQTKAIQKRCIFHI
jgi:hypothetical protein